MFVLKKVVAGFFYPVSLGLEILILGLFFLWVTRRQRLGKVLVTLGTLLLLLLSSSDIASWLLMPLERRYPALLHPETISWEERNPETSPKWIVVLGGGVVSDPRVQPNSQTSEITLGGVVEAVRLYRTIPGSKLLLSGGKVFNPVAEAEVMAQVAGFLGVKPQDMVLETDSRDTADQAQIVAKKLGRENFILVTSAVHMPRSLALFRKRGMQPIPAPTNQMVLEEQEPDPMRFFPGANPLEQAQIAFHEYLGLAWAWLRGQI